MYVHGSIKSKQLPTLKELFKAVNAADESDDKTRDVRPLMSILMRVRNMPRIKGNFLTRRMGAASFNWHIVSDDKANEEKAAQCGIRLKKAINYIIRHHDLTPGYGASLIEFDWTIQTDAGFSPFVKKLYLPIEFERLNESSVQLVDVNSDDLKKGATIIQGADPKFLIDFDDETERGGILRSIASNEVLRRESIIDWSNLNKRLKGIVTGSIDLEALQKVLLSDDQIKEQLDAVDAALTKAGEHNTLRTLSAVKVGFEKIAEAAASGSYNNFIEILNNENAIAILGQANTPELPSQGGSRAALQVLNLIRSDILLGDLLRLTELINDQFLKFDFTVNNKSVGAPPWEFKFIFDENQDLEVNARVLESVSRLGLPLKTSEVYEKIGYTIPAEGDETLTVQTNPVL